MYYVVPCRTFGRVLLDLVEWQTLLDSMEIRHGAHSCDSELLFSCILHYNGVCIGLIPRYFRVNYGLRVQVACQRQRAVENGADETSSKRSAAAACVLSIWSVSFRTFTYRHTILPQCMRCAGRTVLGINLYSISISIQLPVVVLQMTAVELGFGPCLPCTSSPPAITRLHGVSGLPQAHLNDHRGM